MDNTEMFERTIANLSNIVAQQAQQIAALQSFIQGMVGAPEPETADEAVADTAK